jgi:type II secretory pathway predicted ATPase ExeA
VISLFKAQMSDDRQLQPKKRPKSGIKNKIRGIRRLLQNGKISDEARAIQEAKLEELEASEQDRMLKERERKMTLRYRRVRSCPPTMLTRILN